MGLAKKFEISGDFKAGTGTTVKDFLAKVSNLANDLTDIEGDLLLDHPINFSMRFVTELSQKPIGAGPEVEPFVTLDENVAPSIGTLEQVEIPPELAAYASAEELGEDEGGPNSLESRREMIDRKRKQIENRLPIPMDDATRPEDMTHSIPMRS